MKLTIVLFVTTYIITIANCLPQNFYETRDRDVRPDFCYAPPSAIGDPAQYPCTIYITAWWYDPEDHACIRRSILVPTCKSTLKDRGMDLETCIEICGKQ